MIVARTLTKRFGRVTAVDAVDFDIDKGDVVGFLGPNGAGKTTTIRMMVGYLQPTAGSVSIDGIDVQTDPISVRRSLGYLPESAPVYPEMRVIEYLKYRVMLFDVPRARRKSAIERSLERCWLSDVARRPISQLSKGYRQRVGLAATLLHDPTVLVLDEPTVGLDPAQIRAVRKLIAELAGDHTIILSTHILPEVEMTCGSYMMIAGGRIRSRGRVADLGSEGKRRYVVETKLSAARANLAKLTGIERVEEAAAGDGWSRITLTARQGSGDLREKVAGHLQELNAPMRELSSDRTSLEALFMDVLNEAEMESVSESADTGKANR